MYLDDVRYGEIIPDPNRVEDELDEHFKGAYSWLEKQIGFHPLFLSVGETEEDIRMTGYQNQFRKILTESKDGKTYRKKGEYPNFVLFSFDEVKGVFLDYMNWHIVLNSSHRDYKITDYEKRLVLKPSWNKSKWLLYAKRNPHSVQLVVSRLDLRKAERVWCRNKSTKKKLEEMDFTPVEVKRLEVGN